MLMEVYTELRRSCQNKFEENARWIEYADEKDEETLRLRTGKGRPFSISRTSPKENDFYIYFSDDDTGWLQVDYSFGKDGTVHKRVIDYELPTDPEGSPCIISESNGGFTQAKRLAKLISDAEVCRLPDRG
ncbi:MAG: SH3 domain-containing protein [Planctomycetales bacterium]|nr:SH3 domain-containing protein [Planctomycetales bacterium]